MSNTLPSLRHCTALVAAAIMIALPSISKAGIVSLNQNAGSQTFFDNFISSNDLIQAGSSSLLGVLPSVPGNFPSEGANNGNAAQTSGLSYWGGQHNPGFVELTYFLTGSDTGYDITSVNSIYGWQDSRYRHAAQQWQLFISTVLVPTFTHLHSVVYTPFSDYAEGSTMVNLTDTSGVLASGVTGLRFRLTPFVGINQTGEIGVVRELDVFGSVSSPASPVSVPDSAASTASLLVVSGLLVLSARAVFRRRSAS